MAHPCLEKDPLEHPLSLEQCWHLSPSLHTSRNGYSLPAHDAYMKHYIKRSFWQPELVAHLWHDGNFHTDICL